jgi:hypothetical protein
MISLLTCAPGQQQLYTAFGHSAIRVYDPTLGVDHAFNYGVFSFTEGFYLNFARGNSYYKLAVYPYSDFLYEYEYYNRSVSEQILNLTQNQKQRIFDFLVWNAKPENQSYLYDYFYDNCATRVRDVFANQLKGEIQFDSSFLKTDYSIRDLTDLYLEHQPWGGLGIDIGLGLPMDKKLAYYEYMFLPDYIESFFTHAVNHAADSSFSLVQVKSKVFQALPEDLSPSLFHPWNVFGLVLVIIGVVTYFDFRKNRISFWFDGTLLFITGLLGVLLVLLWTATNHQAAANNYNLLWALPTNLVAFYFLLRKNYKTLAVYYRIAFSVSLVLLMGWMFIPQQMNVFLLPVVASLTLRYGLNYLLLGKPSAS